MFCALALVAGVWTLPGPAVAQTSDETCCQDDCPADCTHELAPVCGAGRATLRNACIACPHPIDVEGPCPGAPRAVQVHAFEQANFFHTQLGPYTLNAFNSSYVGDSLRDAFGVSLFRLSRGADTMRLNGLGGRHVVTRVDGLRIDSAALGRLGDPSLGRYAPTLIRRVDVHRGAVSGRYGLGALGGALLLETARPTLTLDGVRGGVLARFASAELETSGAGRFEFRTGDFSLLGGAHGGRTGELRAGSGVDSGHDGAVRFGGNVLAEMRQPRSHLRLHYSTDRVDDLAAPTPDGSGTIWHDDSRHTIWLAFQERPPHENVHSADLRVGAHQIERTLRGADGSERTESSWQAEFGGELTTAFSSDVDVLWSLEGRYERLGAEGDPLALEGNTVVDESTVFGFELASAATITIAAPTHLEMAARMGFEKADVPAVGERSSIAIDDLAASGQVGLRHDFSPVVQGQLRAGSAAGHPGLRDLTALQRTDQGTLLPNPELSGEQLVGADAGLRLALDPVRLEVTANLSYLFDRITAESTGERDPDNLDDAGTPRPYLQFVNLDEARLMTLSALLNVDLADMRFYAQADWTHADDLTEDQPLAGVPPAEGVVGMTYQGGTWSTGAYSRFAASQGRVPEGTDEADGWAVFGVHAEATFLGWLDARLTLDNLSDVRYRLHGSFVDEPGFNGTLTLATDWY